MPISISGSGLISGSNVTFTNSVTSNGALNATGSITQGSTAPFNLLSGQLAFPATQNASSNANTLDDYEEGTWTPVVTASSGTITTYSSSGFYTKIGRVIHLYGLITISNPGTATNQYINFSGLPYASSGAYGNYMGVCRENAVNGYLNQVSIAAGGTSGSILRYDNAGNIVSGGNYYFNVVYTAAA